MDYQTFGKMLASLDLKINQKQYDQLNKYYQLLWQENQKFNLTSIVDEDQVFEKHFFDSLSTIKTFDLKNKKVIDIGAGAGFPLIPIKIMLKDLDITLLDATLKKVNFMKMVVAELGLENVKVVNSRVEDFSTKFDVVVARGLAPLNELVELACNIVKLEGHLIALKGNNYKAELKQAEKAIEVLGYELSNVFPFTLPTDKAQHNNLVLKKVKKHDGRYPRPYAKISKQPL